MKCPHCGIEIPDTSTFCPYCGKKVTPLTSGILPPESSQPASQQTPQSAPRSGSYTYQPSSSGASTFQASSKGKGDNTLLIILLIVAGIILLLCCCCLGLWFLGSMDGGYYPYYY